MPLSWPVTYALRDARDLALQLGGGWYTDAGENFRAE